MEVIKLRFEGPIYMGIGNNVHAIKIRTMYQARSQGLDK
jgi:hypothetical protein